MGLRVDLKKLFCGFLPVQDTAIYTVPTGRRALIKTIRVTSDSDVPRILNIRVAGGATFARLVPHNFLLCGKHHGIDDAVITLDTGDKVMASCDLASSVTCLISGIEELLS